MADWISSKLKAAETFFEQIDHQAAESLKKGEKSSENGPNYVAQTISGSVVPLKDQLKKKAREKNGNQDKLDSIPGINVSNNRDPRVEIDNVSKLASKSKSTLTDSDWTELLSSPNQPGSPRTVNRNNGIHGLRRLPKDGRKQNNLSSGMNRNPISNPSLLNSVLKSDNVSESKVIGKPCDVGESTSSESAGRTSSVDSQIDGQYLDGRVLDSKDVSDNVIVETKDEGSEGNERMLTSKDISLENLSVKPNHSTEMLSVAGRVDGVSRVKMGVGDVHNKLRSIVRGKRDSNAAMGRATSDDLKRGSFLTSDGASDVDSDSGSSSGSESEGEREERRRRREKILAEKIAARAMEAIKERENIIARLEGEKQSLEKILEERAKQQAKEASDLQTTMMETMDAVDLEKQKHKNTRMEALAKLAKLETANADLARSLAIAQWNIEVEVNQLADLRQQIESKELGHEELRRRIYKVHNCGTSLNQLAASRDFEFKREILEAEFSFISDKIRCLQDKAKELEVNTEMIRKEIEDPTEVEVELKRRLGQLTDHLIQKQAQVEALSSEKATLLFRIEAVSRLLDENKSMNNTSSSSLIDVESGTWEHADSKLRPMFEDRIRSGRKHLGSLIVQLDAIFLAGAVFLRRNSSAKLCSVIYLVCLHFWVVYILMSYSQPSNETRSGAVISLENINNTGV